MPRGVYQRIERPVDVEKQRSRFMAKVIDQSTIAREGMTPCWLWGGGDDGRKESGEGYGKFLYNGRSLRAHRVSYMMYKGDIPPNCCIMHMCDKPNCVNPDHLQLGTHKENMEDKKNKGRTAATHAQCRRLTPEEVLEIYQSTEPNRALARKYGLVSPSTIRGIKTGKVHTRITQTLRQPSLPLPSPEESACTPLPPQSPSQSVTCAQA